MICFRCLLDWLGRRLAGTHRRIPLRVWLAGCRHRPAASWRYFCSAALIALAVGAGVVIGGWR